MPARRTSFFDGGSNVIVDVGLRHSCRSQTHAFRVCVPPRTEFGAVEYCQIYFGIVRKIDCANGSKNAAFENRTYPSWHREAATQSADAGTTKCRGFSSLSIPQFVAGCRGRCRAPGYHQQCHRMTFSPSNRPPRHTS